MYYPSTTLIMAAATIRRERQLPPGAILESSTRESATVEWSDIVMRGLMPAQFIVINALKQLGLRRADQIDESMLQVEVGRKLLAGDAILTVGSGRRAKEIKAPVDSIFSRLEGGDIILQANPESIEVIALYPGRVMAVRPATKTVLIESTGGLIQGAWGNGKSTFSQIRIEPSEGFESLLGETLLPEYRNVAVVLRKSITSDKILAVAKQQEVTAIIAPSIRSDLRPLMLEQSIPIFLTEGFGTGSMSDLVFNLLRDNQGRPVVVNAVQPARWQPNRPELLIISPGGTMPSPIMDQPIKVGSIVRVVRSPYAGLSGRVRRLIDTPRALDNGLRTMGAEVQLSSGRTAFIPYANMELLGRPPE